jgi:hypothetical protein
MDNDIKIKISLDNREAAAEIKKLDEQVSGLIKSLSVPARINIQPPAVETITNYKNLQKVLVELNSAVKTNIQLPPAPLEIKNEIHDENINTRFKKGNSNTGDDFLNQQKKLTEIEKKYSSQRQKINSDETKHKLAGLEYMLLSAEGLFSRQTFLYRTLSIAEATMSAYNAANAALLPPPVGAGPILGEIQAALVIMNGLKRVEKIAATQIPGYAKGGIVVGERGPEVIENMQDYAAGRAELVQKTIGALQKEIYSGSGHSNELVGEIKNLRSDIKMILDRPAIAFLDDRQAKKIYYRGNYIARKTR